MTANSPRPLMSAELFKATINQNIENLEKIGKPSMLNIFSIVKPCMEIFMACVGQISAITEILEAQEKGKNHDRLAAPDSATPEG